jgi:L-ascorbate metabolism protein UlaG (beta-lactamase superfamily)
MADVPLTWLGHSAFRFDTPTGKRVYVDPWLGNPKCPQDEQEPERVDVVALTHAHPDHTGTVPDLLRRFEPLLVAQDELTDWYTAQGHPGDRGFDLNRGGSVELDGTRITLTTANHTSSGPNNEYLGEPCGLVFEFEDAPTIYFSGDTNAFIDMQLIRRIFEPDVAVLCIGDHYTMGPREAAVALELLGVRRCVPCHYGTFSPLRGTPDELRRLAPDVEVLSPAPGETITL